MTNNDLQNITQNIKNEAGLTSLKTGVKSGRIDSSCSTCGTRRVNLVTNPVIRNERGKDRIYNIRGHLWYIYSVTVNSSWWIHDEFNLTHMNLWFSSFLVRTDHLTCRVGKGGGGGRGGGVWFFVSSRIFFSDTRVRIFIFFVQNFVSRM
jgi:hypothetical protein